MLFCTELTFDLILRLRSIFRLGIHPYVFYHKSRGILSMDAIMYSILPSEEFFRAMDCWLFNISELSNNHKMLELCSYELPRFWGRVKKSFQQWLHKTHPSWLIISYEWPTRLKRVTREYGWLLSTWDSVSHIGKVVKMDKFQLTVKVRSKWSNLWHLSRRAYCIFYTSGTF